MEARLPTHIWVGALVRRVQAGGAAAFIVQHGDDERGDVLVKVTRLDRTAQAYIPGMGPDGERVFIDLTGQNIGPEEAETDAYISRAMARDRDLWVIEIEDREGRHFLTEPVNDSGL